MSNENDKDVTDFESTEEIIYKETGRLPATLSGSGGSDDDWEKLKKVVEAALRPDSNPLPEDIAALRGILEAVQRKDAKKILDLVFQLKNAPLQKRLRTYAGKL